MGKIFRYNALTDQLDIVQDSSVIILKNVVNTVNDLPLTGNQENDLYIVRSTDSLYTWNNPNPSGVFADWVNAGTVAGVDWSGILNGPSTSPAQIDNASVKAHNVNKDIKLDEGGPNEKLASNIIESVPLGTAKKVKGLTFDPTTNQLIVLFESP